MLVRLNNCMISGQLGRNTSCPIPGGKYKRLSFGDQQFGDTKYFGSAEIQIEDRNIEIADFRQRQGIGHITRLRGNARPHIRQHVLEEHDNQLLILDDEHPQSSKLLPHGRNSLTSNDISPTQMEQIAREAVWFHAGHSLRVSNLAANVHARHEDSRKYPISEGILVDAGLEFLAGGGEMGERIRAFDWTRTPLGPASAWSQSLKTAVGILLNSGYPMYVSWGSDFIQIYNDAYLPILGTTKHPAALGTTSERSFAEIWNDIGPMFRTVMAEAKPSTFSDKMMPLNRYGFAEECFFVFSYSPVLLATGKAGGVFVTVLETTDRVLRERRQRIAKDVAAIHARGSRDAIFQDAVKIISSCPEDAPFAAICTPDERGTWSVASRSGTSGHSNSAILEAVGQAHWDRAPTTPLPLLQAAVCEPWPEPVTEIACRPIIAPGASGAAGVIVFGLSPRLRWDGDYAAYHDMCASNLAAVIADAEAFAIERERAKTLAEIDRAKTVFFSNVSHEFRTPLTLLLGPLEDALADTSALAPGSRHREQLTTAHRNALRLLRLVNSLLDFSRIEAGRTTATFQPTDIIAFTTDLVSSFRSAAAKAGLELVLDTAPLPYPVYVDRDMWENIILNLVSNALKYTFEGSIRVEIAPTADKRSAVLTIRDTGIGIPPHEIPRLFERFHRVEGAPGRSIEGSGIGLALVKELVALHGAVLSVNSEVGRGTAFTLTVPLGSAHLPADRISAVNEPATIGRRYGGFVAEALRWLPEVAANAESDLAANGLTHRLHTLASHQILVVDDNADMRDYLRHLLEGRGYRIELAKNGLDALDKVGRSRPDLVLSDLMMPELDGLGLLARLRANDATKDVPFIALSARAGEESKIEGLNAGADDYLVKPFSSRELFARVDSAIELARVRNQARASLQDEHQRLRRLFEQAPGFMATTRGPNHVFEFANAAYRRLVDERDIIGKPVETALPEVKTQGFVELLDGVYRTGTRYIGEEMALRLQPDPLKSAREVFVTFIYEAITDPDGSVVGVFVEGHDVTVQRETNQHLQLLVSELNHRVKNMLSIVQSVSQQTFKGEQPVEAEKQAFEGRLAALASAHDLLTREDWRSPTFAAVARELFSVHEGERRIDVSGPHIQLNSRTAVTLAMALHELHTNALKYGALSVPTGSVELAWTVQNGPQPTFTMTWHETGGPPVCAPDRRGFGSRLIERALALELRGTARLDFKPDGLVCTIDAPLPERTLPR